MTLPLLRACGGISETCAAVHGRHSSSPRMRRYFLEFMAQWAANLLFSAHAEVFPSLIS